MPRFWVLTDHVRKEVVLVIRGTMSLNELAVDLTCDPAPFILPPADPVTSSQSHGHSGHQHPHTHSQPSTHLHPHSQPSPLLHPDRLSERLKQEKQRRPPIFTYFEDEGLDSDLENIPGSFPFPMDLSVPFPRSRRNSLRASHAPRSRLASEAGDDTAYVVHGGMLRMTRAMGGPGRPVHVAVRDALKRNKGYCAWILLRDGMVWRGLTRPCSQLLCSVGTVLVPALLLSSHWWVLSFQSSV